MCCSISFWSQTPAITQIFWLGKDSRHCLNTLAWPMWNESKTPSAYTLRIFYSGISIIERLLIIFILYNVVYSINLMSPIKFIHSQRGINIFYDCICYKIITILKYLIITFKHSIWGLMSEFSVVLCRPFLIFWTGLTTIYFSCGSNFSNVTCFSCSKVLFGLPFSIFLTHIRPTRHLATQSCWSIIKDWTFSCNCVFCSICISTTLYPLLHPQT